uniref:Protein OSCP1 n=1 Tax=Chlamydomonas leiostraca TaxID=1034604 RepID=A0A7S0S0V4_9CHLO|mmetsp:Transcript_38121/g.96397  ORF Transcript_38121/g.96397 Transcript_38121/m.96397 type:complete len:381 (+) Transcript_38121:106-1248(+)
MSLLAMPMIVVNLGCEMMFILEQRLKAQNIPPDKSGKVLNDVAKTMFDRQYVDKLFTPQELYSVPSVRKIFDRLAHSSIMRLSESSMDKLFDLMIMGWKYQLLCSTKMEGMVAVTSLHLAQIRAMLAPLPDSAACVALVQGVEALVHKTYGGLSLGQQHLLRQTLLRFLQDRRVKVSLFLQEGIQSTATGRLVMPAPATQYAGTVTYYDGSGGIEAQEKLKLKCMDLDPMEFFIHPAPLGTNLYNKDRPKVVPPPRKGDALASPNPADDDMGSGGKSQYAEDVLERGGARGGRQELDLLSALLALKPQADNFKLSLFEGDEGAGPGGARSGVATYQFADGNREYRQGMMASLRLDDNARGGAAAGDEDDLLDLLDNAGGR